jgi:hypothetical protein
MIAIEIIRPSRGPHYGGNVFAGYYEFSSLVPDQFPQPLTAAKVPH